MRRQPSKPIVLAVAFLALLATINGWLLWRTNPLLVANREVHAMGWEDRSLTLLGAGYRSSWLEVHAYARYRPRDASRGSEVYVEIARPLPLLGWQVVEYRVTP